MMPRATSTLRDRIDPIGWKERTRTLPLGHIERTAAEKALDQEYEACHKLERAWFRKLPKKLRKFSTLPNVSVAQELVDHLCDSLGQTRIRQIVLGSPEVRSGAAAHYSRGEIHFKWGTAGVSLLTLIHETAHHFGVSNHGPRFLEVETILFEVVEGWLHQYWERLTFPVANAA